MEQVKYRLISSTMWPDIARFVEKLGDSAKTFRYFKNKDYNKLYNHIATILAYEGAEPIGYGHLDNDKGKVWLGLAVIEGKRSMGIGRAIMSRLMLVASINGEPLYLSVDSDNGVARRLYEDYGFKLTLEVDGKCFYERC